MFFPYGCSNCPRGEFLSVYVRKTVHDSMDETKRVLDGERLSYSLGII